MLRVQAATAELDLGNFAAAERSSREALEIYVQLYGPDHYNTGDVRIMNGQAMLGLGQNRAHEARLALVRGVQAIIAGSSEAEPLAIQGRVALADAMLQDDDPAAALAELDAVIGPYGKLVPADTLAVAQLLLAKALVALHRDLPRARALLLTARAAWQPHAGEWRPQLTDATALLRRLP